MKKVLTFAMLSILLLSLVLAGCQTTPESSASSESAASESAPAESVPVESTPESSAAPESPVSEEPSSEESETQGDEVMTEQPNPIVTIVMDDDSKIVIELMPQYAPNTVNNFVSLVQKGYYDGVVFHRIVPGFVIQGGDPDGTGMGGPGYSIGGEFIENGFTANVISHKRGVISMARTMVPDSAGSQFFIVVDDAAIPALDKKYAAFGVVIEGMDVVDKIVGAPIASGTQDTPAEPRVMKTVTVDTKGVENWPAPETLPEQ